MKSKSWSKICKLEADFHGKFQFLLQSNLHRFELSHATFKFFNTQTETPSQISFLSLNISPLLRMMLEDFPHY